MAREDEIALYADRDVFVSQHRIVPPDGWSYSVESISSARFVQKERQIGTTLTRIVAIFGVLLVPGSFIISPNPQALPIIGIAALFIIFLGRAIRPKVKQYDVNYVMNKTVHTINCRDDGQKAQKIVDAINQAIAGRENVPE